jgi:hypothetical protein
LGKTWHPEHFTCTHCNQELGTRNFFERDGHPYCEPDYHNLFSPRCAYCNGPILDVSPMKCRGVTEVLWTLFKLKICIELNIEAKLEMLDVRENLVGQESESWKIVMFPYLIVNCEFCVIHSS